MLIDYSEKKNVKFISLASGSSGNCYFFSNGVVSFVIDFGIGLRTARKRLAEYNMKLEDIDFVLVTHDHIDHIKHLGTFAEKFSKPVYATESLHNALSNHFATRGKLTSSRVYIESEKEFCFNDVSITPFQVPHDGTDNYGYFINMSGVKIVVATDVGRVNSSLIKYASISNHLIFESNYDRTMLEEGPYRKSLIDRISNGKGHLSNDETANAIKEFYHREIKSLLLCHLSANNNTPARAIETAGMALLEVGAIPGVDLLLECLPRGSASKLYQF